MVHHIVVYLFKHRLLSQLRDILQVIDRSLVFLAQVNSGRTSAHFQSSANPDSSDKLIIFIMIGKSTSIQSLTRDVGIGSKVQVCEPPPLKGG